MERMSLGLVCIVALGCAPPKQECDAVIAVLEKDHATLARPAAFSGSKQAAQEAAAKTRDADALRASAATLAQMRISSPKLVKPVADYVAALRSTADSFAIVAGEIVQMGKDQDTIEGAGQTAEDIKLSLGRACKASPPPRGCTDLLDRVYPTGNPQAIHALDVDPSLAATRDRLAALMADVMQAKGELAELNVKSGTDDKSVNLIDPVFAIQDACGRPHGF